MTSTRVLLAGPGGTRTKRNNPEDAGGHPTKPGHPARAGVSGAERPLAGTWAETRADRKIRAEGEGLLISVLRSPLLERLLSSARRCRARRKS